MIRYFFQQLYFDDLLIVLKQENRLDPDYFQGRIRIYILKKKKIYSPDNTKIYWLWLFNFILTVFFFIFPFYRYFIKLPYILIR